MGIFSRRAKPKQQFRVDGLDLNPLKSFRQVGWQVRTDRQNYDALSDQYRRDAFARKIVAKPAEDATRNGWRIVIPDDTDKQNAYQQALNGLHLKGVLSKEIIYQRMHGDGYANIGVQELRPTNDDTPLDVNNIQNVAFVHPFGQSHVTSYQTNDDPTSVDYGKEQAVVIQPTNTGYTVGINGQTMQNPVSTKKVVIDSSRYFHISLDKMEDDVTGLSIISRCSDELKNLEIALESSGKILREFTFKVFKSDKLVDQGTTDKQFEQAKSELSQTMNTESMVFIGNDDELNKVATPTTGLDTLYSFAWETLSAACGIPKSVLIGEQSGTLAGASQDVINYYDSVKSMQEELLRPQIEYIVKLLMHATDVAGGSEDPDKIKWKIEFNPLWSADDQTQSKTLLNTAQAAAVLTNAGIYAPDESADLINGLGNNNVSGMQTMSTDSAQLTPEQIKQYKDDMNHASHV